MDTGLAGKVAIVTGATANIGRAIALELATEGAKIVVTGRDVAAGAKLVALAKERGARGAVFVAGDMLDPATPARILAEAEKLGPVQVLINNVGGNVGAGFFHVSDPTTWGGDIDLNFGTMLRMTRAVLPGMVERKCGAIVNIGSTAGLVGDYNLPVYSAMKGAVHSFTIVLAKEIGQFGVRVNAVAPYATMSRNPEDFSTGSRFNPEANFFGKLFAGITPEDAAKRARKPILGPMAKPEEVSGIVVFLASDKASYMTGQIVQVDGGSLL
jgi:NAD(P)-dependent dehydrogenase (short-subunit alcohol dehydrogenase family)